ncbi:MAG TPA: hypothetical protein VGX25_32790 [Actinophytocola sp.]|uniref:hypothetical protein n=1 Tax=Actinophytocola sp. TaxID=1872138 RepID=UPI002DDCD42E|nr:hypothetical protein [Actinophytocola sp.]HEV2784188.1 hypothetical protein [Actinophytocola sp.]
MSVPNAVRYAAVAVWALLGLAVLRMILTLAFKDDLVDAWIEDKAPGLPRELVAQDAPAYVGVALVSLVFTVLLGLAAVNLPNGRNWARIVAIVFAALSVLGIVAAFLAPSLVVLQIINVLMALLSIAVIVLLANAEANRFFAAPVR